MNLAVIGNIVTSFSWFGVNLLEIGLHSYGFTDTGAEYLLNFGVVWQLVMLGNGILPLQAWRSFGTSANAAAIGFRKFLACLNIAWLMAALTWFFGVYYTNPSLAWVGKLVSFICLSLVWALGGAARLSIALPSKPQPSLATPPAVPAK
jgi:hypothetical protein